jgi:hypothetical protein
MKLAKEWRDSFPDDDREFENCSVSIQDIRQIQADALQFAMDLLAKEAALATYGELHAAITSLRDGEDPKA